MARDRTTRGGARQELEARARQQAAVAALGQQALANSDLHALMDQTVDIVAGTLDVPYALILALLPDGSALQLQAGVGWHDGLVGHATVATDPATQAGYTLASGGPVIVDDLRAETRFRTPALLGEHGVVSGMSVVIPGQERPFGLLGTYTTRPHRFTADDAHFLQAVANVLAAAVERTQAEDALRLSERRFRALFEQAPLGLISFAPSGRLLEANTALLDAYGLTPRQQEAAQYNVLEDQELVAAGLMDDIRRAFAGTPTRLPALHFYPRPTRTPPGTSPRWERGFLYPVKDEAGAVREVVAMVEDITEQKLAEDHLRETEAQYRSIFEATSDGLIIVDPQGRVAEANAAACRLHGYSYEEFVGLPGTVFIHSDYHSLFAEHVRTVEAGGFFQEQALALRKDGTPVHVEVRGTSFSYKGTLHMLAVVRDITERVQAYTLLEQRVAERTHESSTLLAVSHDVASTLELQPLLALILDHLRTLVDYTAATIFIEEGEHLIALGHHGPLSREQVARLRFPVAQAVGYQEARRRRAPVIIDDLWGDTPVARAMREGPTAPLYATFGYARTYMAVPLMVKERVIGIVAIDHSTAHAYTPQQARLALAIASQAAVAIENARLYARAQQGAAQEERARLARELHDAVTQTLFSASMIAEVVPRLWERDPAAARQRLEDVRLLTRGALAEMRTLLLELRPAALTEAKLGDLLRQLVEALTGRKRLAVTLVVDGERERALPPDVQVALYRVAQEALNNVARHAGATQVEVRLSSHGSGVSLAISDDGRGFDPGGIAADHFGLRIMRERADLVGARLRVESQPGRGTQVQVAWQDPGGSEGAWQDPGGSEGA